LEKPAVAKANEFLARDNNFAIADEDGNTFLSKEEICQILQSTELTEEERASLTFLRDNLDDVANSGNDETGQERSGISQYDLDSFGSKTLEAIEKNLQKAYESLKDTAQRKDSKKGKDAPSNRSQDRDITPEAREKDNPIPQPIRDAVSLIFGGGAAQKGAEIALNS
jgi:hypothetical protein